tara:strand:- start:10451 stop:11329 length:879 start_codon:yes stop_codon:yes gene_type:complete
MRYIIQLKSDDKKLTSESLAQESDKLTQDVLQKTRDNSFIRNLLENTSLIYEALKNSSDSGADEVLVTCKFGESKEIISIDDKYNNPDEAKISQNKLERHPLNRPEYFAKLLYKKSNKDSNKFGGNNLGLLALHLSGFAASKIEYTNKMSYLSVVLYSIMSNPSYIDSKSAPKFGMKLEKSSLTNGARLILVGENGMGYFRYMDACTQIHNYRKNFYGEKSISTNESEIINLIRTKLIDPLDNYDDYHSECNDEHNCISSSDEDSVEDSLSTEALGKNKQKRSFRLNKAFFR